MDITAVRNEMAGKAPDGVRGYAHEPGNAQLPALIVEPPITITSGGTFTRRLVEFSVLVVIAANSGAEAEDRLINLALEVADALAEHGDSYRLKVAPEVKDFGHYSIGATEHLGCKVHLSVEIDS